MRMKWNTGTVWKVSLIAVAVGLLIEGVLLIYEETIAAWPGITMDVLITIALCVFLAISMWYILHWLHLWLNMWD